MSQSSSASAAAMSQLAELLLTKLIEELVADVAEEEFKHSLRARLPCELCGGSCRNFVPSLPSSSQVTNGRSHLLPQSQSSTNSRAVSPSPSVTSRGGANNGSTESSEQFECIICSRYIAYSKYAKHLSQCMGITGRNRTGARRANGIGAYSNGASVATSAVVSEDESSSSIPSKKKTPKKRAHETASTPSKKALTPKKSKLAFQTVSTPHHIKPSPSRLQQTPTRSSPLVPHSAAGGKIQNQQQQQSANLNNSSSSLNAARLPGSLVSSSTGAAAQSSDSSDSDSDISYGRRNNTAKPPVGAAMQHMNGAMKGTAGTGVGVSSIAMGASSRMNDDEEDDDEEEDVDDDESVSSRERRGRSAPLTLLGVGSAPVISSGSEPEN